MSQYSSAYYIITNDQHLLKCRAINHTAAQQANKTLNDENDSQCAIT